MRFDLLVDPQTNGDLATIVNAELDGNKLLCGFVIFRGGIAGEMFVETKLQDRMLKIQIPDEVRRIATFFFAVDNRDRYEIKVLEVC